MSRNTFAAIAFSDSEDEDETVAVKAETKTESKAESKPRKQKKKPAPKKVASTAPSGAAESAVISKPNNPRSKPARSNDKHHATRKREFDRQSGTGRDKSIKKQGAGARNWGKEGEGSEQVTSGEVADEAPAEEVKEEEVEEEEENQMTYEEYQAMLKEKKSSAAFKPLAARKVNNQFGKAKAVKRKDDVDEVAGSKARPKRDRDRNTAEVRKPDVGFTAPAAVAEVAEAALDAGAEAAASTSMTPRRFPP